MLLSRMSIFRIIVKVTKAGNDFSISIASIACHSDSLIAERHPSGFCQRKIASVAGRAQVARKTTADRTSPERKPLDAQTSARSLAIERD